MIHELGHHRAGNHYSDDFHEACCELGAKLKQLAMEQPEKMVASSRRRTNNLLPCRWRFLLTVAHYLRRRKKDEPELGGFSKQEGAVCRKRQTAPSLPAPPPILPP